MNKITQPRYVAPHFALRIVEVESPICAGSIDIEAQAPTGHNIEAQTVNSDFEKDNDFTKDSDASWD